MFLKTLHIKISIVNKLSEVSNLGKTSGLTQQTHSIERAKKLCFESISKFKLSLTNDTLVQVPSPDLDLVCIYISCSSSS